MIENNFKEVLGQQVKKLAKNYLHSLNNCDIDYLKIITGTPESESLPHYKLRLVSIA